MRQVKCPHCGLLCYFNPENPFRPFCSERCKMIDLGTWASEGYAIPVQNQTYNEKELEELYSQLEASESESVAAHQTVAGRKQQE